MRSTGPLLPGRSPIGLETPHRECGVNPRRPGPRCDPGSGQRWSKVDAIGKDPVPGTIVGRTLHLGHRRCREVNVHSDRRVDVAAHDVGDLVEDREDDAVEAGDTCGDADHGTVVIDVGRTIDLCDPSNFSTWTGRTPTSRIALGRPSRSQGCGECSDQALSEIDQGVPVQCRQMMSGPLPTSRPRPRTAAQGSGPPARNVAAPQLPDVVSPRGQRRRRAPEVRILVHRGRYRAGTLGGRAL